MDRVKSLRKSRFFGLFCAFSSGCFRAAICYLTHFMSDGNGFKVNMYTCVLGLMYVKMWQLLTPKLDQVPFLMQNYKMWILSGILGSLSYTAAFQMFSYAPTSDAYSIFLGAELIAGIAVDYFILKVTLLYNNFFNPNVKQKRHPIKLLYSCLASFLPDLAGRSYNMSG